jgi:hypothetical protein
VIDSRAGKKVLADPTLERRQYPSETLFVVQMVGRGGARPSPARGPGAYWGHGPDHRDNPQRDRRRIACPHGYERDRCRSQDASHHRADRNGRHRHRVARGRAPSSRLARRSRCGHPMPAAARPCPAMPQTPGSRLGSLPSPGRRPGWRHDRTQPCWICSQWRVLNGLDCAATTPADTGAASPTDLEDAPDRSRRRSRPIRNPDGSGRGSGR